MTLKIVEGEDIMKSFGRNDYFETALLKMYLSLDTFGDPCFYTNEQKLDDFKNLRIRAYSEIPHVNSMVKQAPLDKWYFITVYNKHHQQFFNPAILALNFDCEKKMVITPWRYDQLYPGYPYHLGPENAYKDGIRTYNDKGEPDP